MDRGHANGINPARESVLIVGIGNELLGDEGLGVHVARGLLALEASLPPGVTVLEAGTALLDILPELERYSRVIIVDAVRTGHPPGTICRAEMAPNVGDPLLFGHPLSLHQWGVVETLLSARRLGLLPGRLTVIGAVPERIAPTMELSPRLAKAAEQIVFLVLEELEPRFSPSPQR